MRIDWWTLGLQTVNVLVLVWLLGRFLFRPVAAIIEARRDEAARMLSEARQAQEAAQIARQEAEAEAAHNQTARAEVLRAAAGEAEATKAAMLAAARVEIEAQQNAMRTTANQECERQRAALNLAAGRLAADIAARLLSRLPEEARITPYLAGLGQAVAALPAATRAEIGQSAPLCLRVPRTLTEQEIAACRSTLTEALGHSVELAVEIIPGIIAGLEFEAAHASVRNSLRADLDAIRRDLSDHGAG